MKRIDKLKQTIIEKAKSTKESAGSQAKQGAKGVAKSAVKGFFKLTTYEARKFHLPLFGIAVAAFLWLIVAVLVIVLISHFVL